MTVIEAMESSRGLQVARINWTDRSGADGNAWIASAAQARKVVDGLRRSGAKKIQIEHHFVPIQKNGLLNWLTSNGLTPTPDRIEACVNLAA